MDIASASHLSAFAFPIEEAFESEIWADSLTGNAR